MINHWLKNNRYMLLSVNPHQFLLLILFISLVACDNNNNTPEEKKTALQNSQISRHEKTQPGLIFPLKEGGFDAINNAQLGPPTRFFSELDDITCHELVINNQIVDWIFYAYQATSNLLLYRCEIYEGEPFVLNSKYGGRDSTAVYTAIKIKNKWNLATIPIPNYDNYSNHSVCDDNIAYWGSNNNTHFASVYSLKEKKVTKEVEFSEFEIRSDNEGYFPKPVWSDGCSKVIYPKYYGSQHDETVIEL